MARARPALCSWVDAGPRDPAGGAAALGPGAVCAATVVRSRPAPQAAVVPPADAFLGTGSATALSVQAVRAPQCRSPSYTLREGPLQNGASLWQPCPSRWYGGACTPRTCFPLQQQCSSVSTISIAVLSHTKSLSQPQGDRFDMISVHQTLRKTTLLLVTYP